MSEEINNTVETAEGAPEPAAATNAAADRGRRSEKIGIITSDKMQ